VKLAHSVMHALQGYVDLQVNGYADIDFNADRLAAADVVRVCRQLRDDGVAGILATVITDELEVMCARLANICYLHDAEPAVRDMIWGIHIEGPFLNESPGYIGAHPAVHARPADVDMMKRLLDAAGGLTRIVTLAPERDEGARVTRMLVDMGVRVSAGHCDPTLDQLQAGIDAGLSLVTHLGNGCPLLLPRHDNVIQRVLSRSERLYIGFIADGVHVPYMALGNYLRCCGIERAYIVTDAVSGAGLGPGEYWLGSRRIVVDENLATWSADRSHLVGSAGTMRHSDENLHRLLGFNNVQVDSLLRDNPARILGFG
jgi:N-acetylglucosamine-6-phosphate deacetylase